MMDSSIRVCVLGLGVIGTTYAYALQKAGCEVCHLVREEKRLTTPQQFPVHLLDGREASKGVEKDDVYHIQLAEPESVFDFIIVSVAKGALEPAIQTIREKQLKGTIIIFCNTWNERHEIEAMVGDVPYIMAFPTAGGCMENGMLNCVLFDHIMLESEEKSHIPNYRLLQTMLEKAKIKAEIPHDMFEWIWIHMAVNAGVTSTAAKEGKLDCPKQLAIDLMGDAKALAQAVRCIRETLKVVKARGVNLKNYRSELLPYRIPPVIAGVAMKRLFAKNELTSRIMVLHNDVRDILHGCKCVYDEGKRQHLELPLFYTNMERVFDTLKSTKLS